jgi:hypothetical protein
VTHLRPTHGAYLADADSAEPEPFGPIVSTGPQATPETPSLVNHRCFDIGAFDLVRSFIEHLVANGAPGDPAKSCSPNTAVDWETLTSSVADARSLEHAIGRAVVLANRLTRGLADDLPASGRTTPPAAEDPFFAFTMADVVPDFGDGSRRWRFTKRVANIMGTRRSALARSAPVVLSLLCVALISNGAR